ncbi:MAG: glycosyltransferase family 4 protein [Nanoarchaeota archaeon]
MKILMIVTTPFVLEKGSSLRVLHIVKILAAAGHKIDVLTYPVGADVKIKNVRVIRVKTSYKKTSPGPSLNKIFADIAVLRQARRFLRKNQYDVIHGEDTEGGFIAALLGKKHGIRTAYDMHNLMSAQMRLHKWYPLIPLGKFIENYLLTNAELIITNWEGLEKKVKERYPKKKTVLLFDAVSSGTKAPQMRLPKKYILYSGNFERYQGLELLIRAYTRAGIEAKLVLIGQPRDYIKRLIQRLGLGKKVIITGKLTVEETNYSIQQSLFCVIPRVHGRQPSMKIIHYFQNHKTILATDIACNHELMLHGKNALLAKPEVEVFAKAMNKLSTDGKLRERLEKGVLEVLPKISQEVGAKRLVTAYTALKS